VSHDVHDASPHAAKSSLLYAQNRNADEPHPSRHYQGMPEHQTEFRPRLSSPIGNRPVATSSMFVTPARYPIRISSSRD